MLKLLLFVLFGIILLVGSVPCILKLKEILLDMINGPRMQKPGSDPEEFFKDDPIRQTFIHNIFMGETLLSERSGIRYKVVGVDYDKRLVKIEKNKKKA